MSIHMRAYPTKINVKFIFCISQKGQIYKLPQSILNKYRVSAKSTIERAKKIIQQASVITPAQAFAEINVKYPKEGALINYGKD